MSQPPASRHPDSPQRHLANLVRGARRDRGWTQAQLAAVAQVTRFQVIALEDERRVMVDAALKILRALDIEWSVPTPGGGRMNFRL